MLLHVYYAELAGDQAAMSDSGHQRECSGVESECCGGPGLRTRVHDSGVRVFVAESVRSAELRSVRVFITRVRSRVSVVSGSSGVNITTSGHVERRTTMNYLIQ